MQSSPHSSSWSGMARSSSRAPQLIESLAHLPSACLLAAKPCDRPHFTQHAPRPYTEIHESPEGEWPDNESLEMAPPNVRHQAAPELRIMTMALGNNQQSTKVIATMPEPLPGTVQTMHQTRPAPYVPPANDLRQQPGTTQTGREQTQSLHRQSILAVAATSAQHFHQTRGAFQAVTLPQPSTCQTAHALPRCRGPGSGCSVHCLQTLEERQWPQ